jgi:uncharacterized repeat protein (TIGR03803 family)
MKSTILTCITAIALFSALANPPSVAAQQAGMRYNVLYTFTGGTDGAVPQGALIQDSQGNLYGTTRVAGDLFGCLNDTGTGCGVVFKLNAQGGETVLHTFYGYGLGDGVYPQSDLIQDAEGNLYGTTPVDGSENGEGVAFKVDQSGNETILYRFGPPGGTNGNAPMAGLVRDQEGNLYGTTSGGGDSSGCGSDGCGVLFKLDPAGNLTVLYNFTGGTDGSYPSADLVQDNQGNFYGTTLHGGGTPDAGVVFKVDATGRETVIYRFTGGADGGSPYAGVVRDGNGNLYGTTAFGGLSGCSGGSDCGVIFKVDSSGRETVLHSFTGGADGAWPYGRLVRDQQGNLYGTTYSGGNPTGPCGGFCGVVFKLTSTGQETVLYSFNGEDDGGFPYAGLLRDQSGNLYGTTENGGDLNSQQGWCFGFGCGVVFKISACETARCQGQ